MSYFDKFQRHEQLMIRMADHNGADVPLAEQVGLTDPEEVHGAVLACTGCAAVERCEEHLDTGAEGLPDYCRNVELIRRLAGDLSDLGLSDD